MENNNIDFNSKTEAAIESPVLCETGEPAYAICHHSGQYISEEQFRAARHSPENFYLSRHEFPGFESLDKKFQQAAHAPEYNHLEWNSFILRGIAMLGSAFLLVVGLIPVLNKGDFVADTLQEIAIFRILPAVLGFAGIALCIFGIRSILQETKTYHAQARKKHKAPTTVDFPLLDCKYEIQAKEEIKANISNAKRTEIKQSEIEPAQLLIKISPSQDAPQMREYRQIYAACGDKFGKYVNAGVFALSGLQNISFQESTQISKGHQVSLRYPVSGQWEGDNIPHTAIEYTINPNSLFFYANTRAEGDNARIEDRWTEGKRFFIECMPELDPTDSYRLNLVWRWFGDRKDQDFHPVLKLCKLDAQGLDKVTYVNRGRAEETTIFWRDLPFSKNADGIYELKVYVRFKEPIVKTEVIIEGSYCIQLSDLVSGLCLGRDNLWGPLGTRLSDKPGTIIIRKSSVFQGEVEIKTSLLTAQHEIVKSKSNSFEAPPDMETVSDFVKLLVDRPGISVQRIQEARPHSVTDRNEEAQVAYWDVDGRMGIGQSILTPLDFHVIIAGNVPVDASASDDFYAKNNTKVIFNLRRLYDPLDEKKAADELEDYFKIITQVSYGEIGEHPKQETQHMVRT